ncbi:hypothetical protein, partial [Eisenbergiella tayi]|uniref:hypothetical protein n=1 Tax=Eisenbergiella tayi TaxID=1432052 RepID=UPI002A83ECAD
QPKDRRVYTPLTGSSAWPGTAAERGRPAEQDTQDQRLERGCTVMAYHHVHFLSYHGIKKKSR